MMGITQQCTVLLVKDPDQLAPVFSSKANYIFQADKQFAVAARIRARMQQEGTAMVGFQPVHGINAFRMLYMNRRVTNEDVDAVLDHIANYGEQEWTAL